MLSDAGLRPGADLGADDEHRGRGEGLAADRALGGAVPVAHQPRQPRRLLRRLHRGAPRFCHCWGHELQACASAKLISNTLLWVVPYTDLEDCLRHPVHYYGCLPHARIPPNRM